MINLYARDLPRAAAFYSELGFVEAFRTPASGEPVHIELTLDGFTLGIATDGYLLDSGNRRHSALVGRTPGRTPRSARDALVPLLEAEPGGSARARAPNAT